MTETTTSPSDGAQPIPKAILIIGAVVAAVVFVLVLLVSLGGDENGTSSGAEVACKQFVRERLKSPSTAEFPRPVTENLYESRWRVEGVVDSQNGFGAMVRTQYTCEVHRTSDDVWNLVDLTVR